MRMNLVFVMVQWEGVKMKKNQSSRGLCGDYLEVNRVQKQCKEK